MPRLRLEFVQFGDGIVPEVPHANVIRRVISSLAPVTVTGTALAGEARPVVPAGDSGPVYAIARALDGAVIIAWGVNPTAAQSGANMKWVGDGEEVAILVTPGNLISAVTAV